MPISGNSADSIALVKQIKNRANEFTDNPLYSQPDPDPNDPNGVAAYVLDERDKEFIYEGKRWFDLVRYARRNFPSTLYILTNAVAANASASLQQLLITKYKDPNSLFMPIYYNEINLDPNLVQNPFYK